VLFFLPLAPKNEKFDRLACCQPVIFLRCQPAAWWETVIGGQAQKENAPQV
jgi:hypothetical protein